MKKIMILVFAVFGFQGCALMVQPAAMQLVDVISTQISSRNDCIQIGDNNTCDLSPDGFSYPKTHEKK
jgi:hypothetical protein